MSYTCNKCYFYDQCIDVNDSTVYLACDYYTPLTDDINDHKLCYDIYNERKEEFRKFWNIYINENLENFF